MKRKLFGLETWHVATVNSQAAGYKKAIASKRKRQAVVEYDEFQTNLNQILKAVNIPEYEAPKVVSYRFPSSCAERYYSSWRAPLL